MLKPMSEVLGNSKTLQKIEQVKVQTVAKLYSLCFSSNSVIPEVQNEIERIVKEDAAFWRAKWCIRIRRCLLGVFDVFVSSQITSHLLSSVCSYRAQRV